MLPFDSATVGSLVEMTRHWLSSTNPLQLEDFSVSDQNKIHSPKQFDYGQHPTTCRMSLQELQDSRRRLEEEQLLREQAEDQLRLQPKNNAVQIPRCLPCHVHSFLGLSIQRDNDSSTEGDPANADVNFLRPRFAHGPPFQPSKLRYGRI